MNLLLAGISILAAWLIVEAAKRVMVDLVHAAARLAYVAAVIATGSAIAYLIAQLV